MLTKDEATRQELRARQILAAHGYEGDLVPATRAGITSTGEYLLWIHTDYSDGRRWEIIETNKAALRAYLGY